METIKFYFVDVPRIRIQQVFVRGVIRQIARDEKHVIGEINIIFCTDDYLLNLNKSFLDHDYLTDIITFDNSGKGKIAGELYISADRVRENSKIYSVSFMHELMRVIIHGVLHLLGYNDKGKNEIEVMRKRENYYLDYCNIEL